MTKKLISGQPVLLCTSYCLMEKHLFNPSSYQTLFKISLREMYNTQVKLGINTTNLQRT